MPEQVIADLSKGLNLTAGIDKIPDNELLLADSCRFDELGNVASFGATTKQNSSAYTDSGNTSINSLWINPTVRHLAGVGNDIFSGTSLSAMALLNNGANSSSAKVAFCNAGRRVFYDVGGTPRWVDDTNLTNTVDWPAPYTAAASAATSAGTGASVGSGTAWTNPGNIVSSNDTYATVSGIASASTTLQILRATNFGFAVAGNILGIVVEIEGHTVSTPANNAGLGINGVYLVKSGSPVGDNRAVYDEFQFSYTGLPDTTDAYVSYGSSSDLWGTTWTAAEINAATFGVQFQMIWQSPSIGSGSVDGFVDHVRITIYTDTGSFTVATGAAGNPNGTYTYKATFVDADGVESQASQATASVAPASQIVNVSNIPTGDNRTVKRYIYRKGGSLTFYYWVGEVSDNTTTTFSDNLSDATVLTTGLLLAGEVEGDQANTRFGASSTGRYPEFHYDRVFWVSQEDYNRLRWSKPRHPFAYPESYFISVGDSKPIYRIVSFLGDLIIFKSDSIWRLSGKTESTFVLTRTPSSVGCDMPYTVVPLQDRIMFCNSRGVWYFDGITARLATNRLEKFFDGQTWNGIAPISTTSAMRSFTDGVVANGVFYLLYSDNGFFPNNILVIDILNATIARVPRATARSLAVDPTTQDVYIGDSNGFIRKLDNSTDDGGSSISWAIQTKYFDQKRGDNKSYNAIEIDIDTGGNTITPTVLFNDGDSSAALSTMSASTRTKFYRPIPASTYSRKGRNISIKLSGTLSTINSSGSPACTVYGFKIYFDPLIQRSRVS